MSCLLCLEVTKDSSNCISLGSKQWNELNITKIIEQHLWSLPGSCICLSCWREVHDFHKFYLRIKNVHVNFNKIEVESFEVGVKCKEEFTIETFIKGEDEKDKMELSFIEPEVVIDQIQHTDLSEEKIFRDNDKDTLRSDSSDDLDNIPLGQAYIRLRLQKNSVSKDPLEKSTKCKRNRNCKTKLYSEEKSTENDREHEIKVKEELLDSNSVDNDSNSMNEDDESDVSHRTGNNFSEKSDWQEQKANSRKNRIENDKFIGEHFKQIFCDLCQDPFDKFSAIQKHFTNKHKQRAYVVCCKRKFFGRTRLVDHLQCHLNPDHFKCNDCGKVMSDRNCFNNHKIRVHRPSEVVKKHCCDICGKSFIKPYVLRTHKLSHLAEEEKKFPCTECGKNYGSSYLLNHHTQVVHLKRFVKVCYICGKSKNSSAEFKIHMNKHEATPIPTINCNICGLRLTSERGLKLHQQSQHPVGGKKEHHCSFCQRVSPTLKALQKHIRTMHKKGYDHKCSICEKEFKRAEALREHMATHTGEALYTCPWCPKTFNSNGNMHAHRKKLHPKEWEESKLQKYSDV